MENALLRMAQRKASLSLLRSCITPSQHLYSSQSKHLALRYGRPGTLRLENLSHLQFPTSGLTQRRTILTWIRTNTAQARKESPILFPTLLIAAAVSLTALGYVAANEYYHVGPQYAAFPPEVEQHLRRAIRFSEIQFNPEKSFRSFTEALTAAEAHGMDQFSDEVLGIHIRLTAMLEKAGKAKSAIEILERISGDCLSWVSDYDQNASQKLQESSTAPSDATTVHHESSAEAAGDRRARLFHKAIECKVKAAELYESDYIQNTNTAKDTLSDTFTLVVKESQRTGMDVPQGMTKSEVGAIADQLALLHLQSKQPQLAAPLLLFALNNLRQDEPSPTCKQITVMSNLAIALVSMKHFIPDAPPRMIEDAKQWAEKAIEVAAHIQPPVRDNECDRSCVAATFNLAQIERTLGNEDRARKKYQEALSLAKAAGINETEMFQQQT